eukprot:170146-Alexandrium_andersonii.AAC.1
MATATPIGCEAGGVVSDPRHGLRAQGDGLLAHRREELRGHRLRLRPQLSESQGPPRTMRVLPSEVHDTGLRPTHTDAGHADTAP